MQELLRHSSLRSTLDVYTQAITPAEHAAQAALMSLVFSSQAESKTCVVLDTTGRTRSGNQPYIDGTVKLGCERGTFLWLFCTPIDPADPK